MTAVQSSSIAPQPAATQSSLTRSKTKRALLSAGIVAALTGLFGLHVQPAHARPRECSDLIQEAHRLHALADMYLGFAAMYDSVGWTEEALAAEEEAWGYLDQELGLTGEAISMRCTLP